MLKQGILNFRVEGSSKYISEKGGLIELGKFMHGLGLRRRGASQRVIRVMCHPVSGPLIMIILGSLKGSRKIRKIGIFRGIKEVKSTSLTTTESLVASFTTLVIPSEDT